MVIRWKNWNKKKTFKHHLQNFMKELLYCAVLAKGGLSTEIERNDISDCGRVVNISLNRILWLHFMDSNNLTRFFSAQTIREPTLT